MHNESAWVLFNLMSSDLLKKKKKKTIKKVPQNKHYWIMLSAMLSRDYNENIVWILCKVYKILWKKVFCFFFCKLFLEFRCGVYQQWATVIFFSMRLHRMKKGQIYGIWLFKRNFGGSVYVLTGEKYYGLKP